MINNYSKARPFARAVFDIAKENNSCEIWSNALEIMAEVAADKNISALVDDPRFPKGQLIVALKETTKNNFPDEFWDFLKLLLAKKELRLIFPISVLFKNYRERFENKIAVNALTARQFTEEQKARLISALMKRLKSNVSLSQRVDPSLIGGIIIRIGDRVIDASVRTKLQKVFE